MNLQKKLVCFALRNSVRIAWCMARGAVALGNLGEKLENHASAQAAKRDIDITTVIAPLVERCIAA